MSQGIVRSAGITLLATCAGIIAMPGQSAAQQARQVTFTRDVAPILHRSCSRCHGSGDIAPMTLLTYKDARPWARAIKDRVVKREMPPWFLDRNIGIQKYENDPSLSDHEIDTVVKWVDAGAPPGLYVRDLLVVGTAAAIGFMVSLFFATAAFPSGTALAETKMGALVSFVAAPLAFVMSRVLRGSRAHGRRTGEQHSPSELVWNSVRASSVVPGMR